MSAEQNTSKTSKPELELAEVATSLDGRDITRAYVDPMRVMQPDDTVLMQRGGGDYTIYREVIRDDRVKSALQQRFQAVVARPWEVKPGGDSPRDKAAAEDLKQQLSDIRFDAITEKMLYGVFYGYAVGEAMWGLDGSRVVLRDVKVRDRRRFGYDGLNQLRMRTMQKPDGELLPPKKFWHFSTGADHDDAPYGLGLAHWLYWPVWLKRNGIRFWAVFLEKFGTPTAAGTFPPGTSLPDQNKLLSSLHAIQRDSAIIFPEGMTAELIEATRSGTADHARFVELMNEAISIVTIGQTATTQGTPGRLGNDQAQAEVRADIAKADADVVCMSFNATIARWLTDWNFPGAAYPKVWRVMDDPEDANQAAERDERLAKIGYKPTLERVIEVYGEGYEPAAPVDGAALTPGGFIPKPQSTRPVEFAAASTPESPKVEELLTDALDKQAGPDMAAWLETIRAMLDSSHELEEFRAKLLTAYPDIDRAGMVTAMAEAFAAGHLWGASDVVDEE